MTGDTTLEYVDAVAKVETLEWESVAAVNATTDREAAVRVRLQVERDNATEERMPKHVAELELTADLARPLAGTLEMDADRAGNGDETHVDQS